MSEGKKISMKLLVDTNKQRVLFAEAEKECVDFLFHILSLPIGSVVEYLTKSSMVGSVGNLYGSLESLGVNYVQQGLDKDCLLKPKPASGSSLNVPLLTNNQAPLTNPDNKTFYACQSIGNNGYNYNSSNHMYVCDGSGGYCPTCKGQMNKVLSYVASPAAKAEAEAAIKERSVCGYVKGVVSYMVMDDLCVKPMSMVSGIAILNRFNVKSVGGLEEREVTLDINLAVALLKASLSSKTVLTDVFLGRKGADIK